MKLMVRGGNLCDQLLNEDASLLVVPRVSNDEDEDDRSSRLMR